MSVSYLFPQMPGQTGPLELKAASVGIDKTTTTNVTGIT